MSHCESYEPELLETAQSHIIDDLTIVQNELGRGSYGIVYAAEYNGKPCVAKVMHPFLSSAKNYPRMNANMYIIKEINTLSRLRHPSIVQFLGVYFKSDSCVPILVMERMWKDLCTQLEEQPNQLPLLIKTHILYDVACGLQYLHGLKEPVIHCCLGTSNIMLNENLEAKIVDFGQATKHLENLQKLSTCPGNPAYMPPEALKHNPVYDTKLDIFSFGCTIITLITEKFPMPTDQFITDTTSYIKVSEVDRRMEYIDLMPSNNDLLKLITLQCLQDVPTCRPAASDICIKLEKHFQQFEVDSHEISKQYKQDKLFLIQSMQVLENELEGAKKVSSEENEILRHENQLLRMELLKLNEINEKIVSQNSHTNSSSDAKQNEVISADQKYSDLQDIIKNFRETCKVELQNTTDSQQQEIASLAKERKHHRAQLVALKNQLEFHCNSVVATIAQKCAENEKLMDDLSNTLAQYQKYISDGNLWKLMKENKVLMHTIIHSCDLKDDKVLVLN